MEPSHAHLRVALPDDAAAVQRLLTRSYSALLAADYPADLLAAVLPAITRAKPELLASRTWYVVEGAGGVLLACGGFTRERPGGGANPEGLGHVRHVATDPEATRRGYAGAILRRVFRDAAGAGLVALECLSTLTAEPFYAAQGFRRQRRVDVALGPMVRFPCIEMLCDVDHPPA